MADPPPPAGDPSSGRDLLSLLASTPQQRRRNVALGRVSRELEQVVGTDGRTPPPEPDRKLFEIGVSSLNLHELRARLEAACGTELPIPLFFAHSTLAALADHLVSLVRDDAGEAHPAAEEDGPAEASVASLTEPEAEARLLRRLDELERRLRP